MFPVSTALGFAGLGILVPKEKLFYLGLSDFEKFLMLLNKKAQKTVLYTVLENSSSWGQKGLCLLFGILSFILSCAKFVENYINPMKARPLGIQTLLGMKVGVMLPVKMVYQLNC